MTLATGQNPDPIWTIVKDIVLFLWQFNYFKSVQKKLFQTLIFQQHGKSSEVNYIKRVHLMLSIEILQVIKETYEEKMHYFSKIYIYIHTPHVLSRAKLSMNSIRHGP